MASDDKDVAVKNVVLNESQQDINSNQNKIPDAGDQSSNFPREELFKQNIQMGEASLSIQDEALQQAGSANAENINSSINSEAIHQPQDTDSQSAQESSLGSASNSTSSSSKSSNNGNASTDSSSVLFSEAKNAEQSNNSNDTNANQTNTADASISENSVNLSSLNSPSTESNSNSDVDNEASSPILNVEQAMGDEDTAIALDISAALTDSDGSESLVIEIQNIPAGAILTDGVNSFSASISDTSVNVSEWNTDALTITPASNNESDFDLTISATSTEQSNNATTTTTASLNVVVNSVNDAPEEIVLDGTNVAENSDGAVIGTLSTSDVDSGDTHSYSVSDARFEVVDGKLQLKAGVKLDYEQEQSIDLDITSTDLQGASVTQTITLDVQDVVEKIIGSNNADYLKGGIGADNIIALDGNSTLR